MGRRGIELTGQVPVRGRRFRSIRLPPFGQRILLCGTIDRVRVKEFATLRPAVLETRLHEPALAFARELRSAAEITHEVGGISVEGGDFRGGAGGEFGLHALRRIPQVVAHLPSVQSGLEREERGLAVGVGVVGEHTSPRVARRLALDAVLVHAPCGVLEIEH